MGTPPTENSTDEMELIVEEIDGVRGGGEALCERPGLLVGAAAEPVEEGVAYEDTEHAEGDVRQHGDEDDLVESRRPLARLLNE